MYIDCHTHLGVDLFCYFRGVYPYAQDLPALITEARRHGIARWVVFPMVSNLWFDVRGLREGRFERGSGLEAVPYAFENDRMMREIYELHPELGRLTLPFAIVDPERETQAQVRSLRALHRQFPFHGLKIQASIIQARTEALLTEGHCLLDLAAELDVPMLIHSSVAKEDVWSNAATLLRVAEATPHVRFILAHSCRFDRAYLERVAELPNTWFDCSAHCIHCDAAVDNLFVVAEPGRRFAADYRDPAATLSALAAAYPTKLIWGSDSPFESYIAKHDEAFLRLKSSYEREAACLHALPADLRAAAGRENLLAALRLKNPSVITE